MTQAQCKLLAGEIADATGSEGVVVLLFSPDGCRVSASLPACLAATIPDVLRKMADTMEEDAGESLADVQAQVKREEGTSE